MAVQIWLLGEVGLSDQRGEAIRLTSRRSWGLLAFLALSSGRVVQRTQLAETLWPDRADDQARASLRQEIAVTRKALREAGLDPIETSKETVHYSGGPFLADVSAFDRLVEAGGPEDVMNAARLYRGPLLSGVTLRAPEFERWLSEQRARLKARAVSIFTGLVQTGLEVEDAEVAEQGARALLAADPAAELGHRALMRAFVMTDRHGEAIRHIDQCHAAMLQAGRRALEPETQALIEELRGSPIPEGTRVERFDLPSADIQIPPKPKPVAPRAKPPKPPVGMGRADRTMASIVVAYLPELAAFDLRFDPAAIERAEARFRDFAARVAEESEGALVADTGAWIVMRFSDPGQAGLGALLLAAEPIAVDGGPPVAASCGIAHGMIQARTSGLAGVPVAVASRGAMLAQTGEVLAHEVMSPSLGRDFALSTGVEGYVVVAAQAGEPERIETAQMHGALPPSGPELEVAQAGLDAAALSPQEHWSRWLKALERGDLRGARDQGERIAQDPRPEVGALAPAALGVVRFLRGQLPSAGEALQAVDATQPAEHDLPLDPGLIGRAVLAWLRALEGAPGPAAEDLRRVMSEAQSAGAAGDVQVCSVVAAIVQDELGDARASIGAAREAAKRIAEGTVWHALARAVVGRARDRAGEAAGVSQIEEGLKAYRAMGGTLAAPLLQTWLATAQLELGDTRKGLALVDDALGQTTASDALIWEPELLRLQAVLLVRHGGIERSELETCFVAALESARRTGAALHELRIATSFASYLYGLGRVRDAMARLDRGIAGIKPGGPITLDMKSALSLRRRVEMG